jgi:hypothetical protein
MILAWTALHLNKRWIIFLEVYVALHAVIVAVWNNSFFGGANMWPMFLSGFAFMFIFTYMFAFKANKKIYAAMVALYVVFLAFLYLPSPYGFGFPLQNLMMLQFLWIPIILYLLAGVFAVLAYLKIRK